MSIHMSLPVAAGGLAFLAVRDAYLTGPAMVMVRMVVPGAWWCHGGPGKVTTSVGLPLAAHFANPSQERR